MPPPLQRKVLWRLLVVQKPCLCSSCGALSWKLGFQTPDCRRESRRSVHVVAGTGGPIRPACSDYSRSSGLMRASVDPHKPSGPGPGLYGSVQGGKLRQDHRHSLILPKWDPLREMTENLKQATQRTLSSHLSIKGNLRFDINLHPFLTDSQANW